MSHHPPVSAFHADSEDFVFHGSIHPKLKFWGKSIEIHPKGIVTVELPRSVYFLLLTLAFSELETELRERSTLKEEEMKVSFA